MKIKIIFGSAVLLALVCGVLLYFGLVANDDTIGQTVPTTGLQIVAGNVYYYGEDGEMQYGWQTIDGNRYFFDIATGAAVKGWFTDEDGQTYYLLNDGTMVIGEYEIDGETYIFDSEGRLQENADEDGFVWKEENGKVYGVNSDGEVLIGLHQLFGSYYYFDENGVRQDGLQTIDGKTYYFSDDNGRGAKGWTEVDGKTYYFGDDGYALTGKQTINEREYTFSDDGVLMVQTSPGNDDDDNSTATSIAPIPLTPSTPEQSASEPTIPEAVPTAKWETDENGNQVYRKPDGTLVTGIFHDGTGLVYCDVTTGVRQTGLQTDGSNICYIDASTGYAVTSTWQSNPDDASQYYYFGDDGLALKSMQEVSGEKYFFDPTTGIRQSGLIRHSGNLYYFGGTNDSAVTGWHTVGDTTAVATLSLDNDETGGIMALSLAGNMAVATNDEVLIPQDGAVINSTAKTYYFSEENHAALTGLQKITENGVAGWYGFDVDGSQLIGWQTIDDVWYMFSGAGGSAKTNSWETHPEDLGASVYLLDNGAMAKGLHTIDDSMYCFDTSGKKQTGLVSVDGYLYSFTGENNSAVVSTWVDGEEGVRYYMGEDGKAYVGANTIGEDVYVFGADAVMLVGKQEIDGKVYFLATDGKAAKNSWQYEEDGAKAYYVGADGAALVGVQTIDGDTYYFSEFGLRESGMKTVNGKMYLFNGEQDKALTGPQTVGAAHYLFGQNGAALSGVQTVDGELYYYDTEDYTRQSGWQTSGGDIYFFDETTMIAKTGWFTDVNAGGVYRFDDDGRALTGGPHTIDDVVYHFDEDGRMKPQSDAGDDNWVTSGGNKYYVDANGDYVKGLREISGALYYFASSGAMQTGLVDIEDALYYFGDDGKAVGETWQEIEGNTYYFGTQGVAYTGIQFIGDDLYRFDEDGVQQTGEYTENGVRYYFDAENDGKAHSGWYPEKNPSEDDTDVRYYSEDTFAAVTGMQWIDDEDGNALYAFDDAGYRKSGWQKDENNLLYYFGGPASSALVGGFNTVGENRYYFTDDGYVLSGLQQIGDGENAKWYAFNADGVQITGSYTVNGNTYYFDASNGGAALVGEHTLGDGYTYYFHDEGAYALTGIHYMDGRTYVFNPQGHLISKDATEGFSWKYENDVWTYTNSANEVEGVGVTSMSDGVYFFEDGGVSYSGWQTINDVKYRFGVNYAEDKGKAAIGWYTEDGEAYYFGQDGGALTGEQTINEILYDFNEDGTLKEGYSTPVYNEWRALGDGRMYYDAAGKPAVGLLYIESGMYEGTQMPAGFYFFDETGLNVSGWQTENGLRYYFDPESYTALTGWNQIDGTWYLFDDNTAEQKLEWQMRAGEDGNTFTHYYDSVTGAAPQGWSEISGMLRYFFPEGHMAVGWQDISEDRYYFYQNGDVAKGVVTIGDELYSFDNDGKALSGWNTDEANKRYYFEDGIASSGWHSLPQEGSEDTESLRWYYFDENDFYQRIGWQVRPLEDGTTHRFYYNTDGSLPAEGWQVISGVERYVFDDGHVAIGWQVLPDGLLYHFNEQGQKTTGTQTISGISYSFGEDGGLTMGWSQVGTSRYYIGDTGAATGWMEIDSVWYSFAENGVQQKGFQTRQNSQGAEVTHYYDADGEMMTGWITEGANRYYFSQDGVMATGWTEVDEQNYYFMPENGQMAKGVVEIDGVMYSFSEDGAVQLGFVADDEGNRYYITENGALKGWNQIEQRWYNFDDTTGTQQLGWQSRTVNATVLYYYYDDQGNLPQAGWNDNVDGQRRYVLQDGQMARDIVVIDDETYAFDSKGVPMTGWQEINSRWYLFGTDGAQQTGWQERQASNGYEAQYYYFADGSLPQAGWNTEIENTKRYVTSDGEMARGLMTIDGFTYYFDEKGVPQTGTHTVNGETYVFDNEGRYVAPPVITSVSFGSTWTSGKKDVIVGATANSLLTSSQLSYSFDGGSTWQSSNKLAFAAGYVLAKGDIQVKDSAGNITEYGTAVTLPAQEVDLPMYGIDVSSHQGYIDWAAVAASGVEFAVIRSLHWNRDINYYDIDPYFDYNVRQAKANGILVGTYLYSYAFNDAEMAEEIQVFMNSPEIQGLLRDGITFDLPVFIDYEDPLISSNTTNQTIAQRTQTVRYGMVLIEQLSNYQFIPGFYVSRSWATNMISATTLQNEGYDLWLAHWGISAHGWSPMPSLWQYNNGTYFNDTGVPGISGRVDKNYMYKTFGATGSGNTGSGDTGGDAGGDDTGGSGNSDAANAILTVKNQYGNTVSGPAHDIIAQIVMAEVGGFGNNEVYKAQAVAAQSWLAYRTSVGYSVSSVALATPTQQVRDAVNQVMGQTLTYQGSVAMTPYYAYNNGMTNDAKYWNKSNNFPYLVPVQSSYDAQVKSSYSHTMTEAQVRQRLSEVYDDPDEGYYIGTYLDSMHPSEWIKITERNAGGYAMSMLVAGHRTPGVEYFYLNIIPYSSGGKTNYPIGSPDFDISYSNGVFTFTTSGYGHCVGMSQYGAYGMAIQGHNYQSILSHYYPGTTLTT